MLNLHQRLFSTITVVLLSIMIIYTITPVDAHLLDGHDVIDVNGQSHNLGELEGKLVLIEAFATWCGACQQEHDELTKLYNEYSQVIYMVNLAVDDRDTMADIIQYTQDYPTPWFVWVDDSRSFRNEFSIGSYPTLILFNQEGRVLQRWSGFTEFGILSNAISQYLTISNPQPSDTISGFDSGDGSGSVIEDLFGSTLFRITSLMVLVVLIYVKMTGSKAAS